MTIKKTQEEFEKDVYNLTKGEYSVIGEYTLSRNKVKIRHEKCGNEYLVKANNFMNGKRCPKCNNKRKYNSRKDIEERLANKYNNNLKLIGDYHSTTTKTTFKCIIHNEYIETTPKVALSNNKNICSKCKGEYIRNIQLSDITYVKDKIKETHGGNISLLGDYKGVHSKSEFICNNCGVMFYSETNSVLKGSGCPKCKLSRGEREISKILDRMGIEYEQQKTFDSCRNKRKLPFDFYLKGYNTLIEYDGLQHEKPIEYFGGEYSYNNQIKRDKIKNEFAKNNNYNLIRIKYTENIKNIEKIIQSHLSKM